MGTDILVKMKLWIIIVAFVVSTFLSTVDGVYPLRWYCAVTPEGVVEMTTSSTTYGQEDPRNGETKINFKLFVRCAFVQLPGIGIVAISSAKAESNPRLSP